MHLRTKGATGNQQWPLSELNRKPQGSWFLSEPLLTLSPSKKSASSIIKQKSMHFGVFKAFAMTWFGSKMNATLETFGQKMLKTSQEYCCASSCHGGTQSTNESSIRCDSRSTAQSPFEIFEAELPGTSLEPRGKEARPPPSAPGLGGAEPNCCGRSKCLGGLRPVWPDLGTATRADCTDCICAKGATGNQPWQLSELNRKPQVILVSI